MNQYNPYAPPPGAHPTAIATHTSGEPLPWEVGDVLGHAWTVFKPHWATLVFAQLLTRILGAIPNYVPGILVGTRVVAQRSTEYYAVFGVCMLLGGLVSTFFTAGMIRIWCAAARGQMPEFAHAFSGGPPSTRG